MPLIAYQTAHGCNDYPLHFAFFEAMERRGILDHYDFALDPMVDYPYCEKLMKRFPQLHLTEHYSWPRTAMRWMRSHVGRFYRPLGMLDRFDAVCEGCGGHIHPHYLKSGVFRAYPRVRRRAILFQSIEDGALANDEVRESIAQTDLIIARTGESAKRAKAAGAKRVVESCDIVFSHQPREIPERAGIAVALRVPNQDPGPQYLAELRRALEHLRGLGGDVDFVQVEGRIGQEMRQWTALAGVCGSKSVYHGDDMYIPFSCRRQAIISARLHTTILALLHGNRAILQFQIEEHTHKMAEMLRDIGLTSLVVRSRDALNTETMSSFLASPEVIGEQEVECALAEARRRVETGLDAFEEWLESI